MSMSNSMEQALLEHIFQNLAITLIGDAAGLLPSAVAGNLFVSLHTGDPGEAGDQTTSEATYTGYARVAVVRSAAGWTIAAPTVSNAAAVTFPAATGGSSTVTFVGIGASTSGAGRLIVSGALTASLAVTNGITPQFAIGALTCTAD